MDVIRTKAENQSPSNALKPIPRRHGQRAGEREKSHRNSIVGYDVISENRLHEIAVGSKPYRWFLFFFY